MELAARYNEQGADELVFLDITASSDERETMVDVVARTAREVFIPLTVGGGIRSRGRCAPDPARRRRQGQRQHRGGAAAGADLRVEPRIRRAGGGAGDRRARRRPDGGWNVYTRGGRHDEGIDAVEWARAARNWARAKSCSPPWIPTACRPASIAR